MKHVSVCTILLSLLIGAAQAKDLGVQGNLWPITEVDIRQMMVESAARTHWGDVQGEVKSSAEQYLANLPKRNLPSPEQTQTAWMDPSIELSSDIQVPVKQADGSYAWQVLYPKGTRVNPLDKYHPVTAMFLFDGSNAEQVKLAQQILAVEPDRIVPVEAGSGDLKTVNETLHRPVFYANDSMMGRFQVRYLPSLIFPGTGAQERLLGIASFAAPYRSAEVLSAWPTLGHAPVAADQKGPKQ